MVGLICTSMNLKQIYKTETNARHKYRSALNENAEGLIMKTGIDAQYAGFCKMTLSEGQFTACFPYYRQLYAGRVALAGVNFLG